MISSFLNPKHHIVLFTRSPELKYSPDEFGGSDCLLATAVRPKAKSHVQRRCQWPSRSRRRHHCSNHHLSSANCKNNLSVFLSLSSDTATISISNGDLAILQVNTRQQTERVAKKGLRNLDGSSSPPQSRPTSTLLQIIQVCIHAFGIIIFLYYRDCELVCCVLWQVLQTEGWGGLYSGLKPSLLGTAASQVDSSSQIRFYRLKSSWSSNCWLVASGNDFAV